MYVVSRSTNFSMHVVIPENVRIFFINNCLSTIVQVLLTVIQHGATPWIAEKPYACSNTHQTWTAPNWVAKLLCACMESEDTFNYRETIAQQYLLDT